MADGELILTIDATLAQRLRARAASAGQSVEAYALHLLENPDAAIWAEVDEICDSVVAEDNGVPLDELGDWMKGWGEPDGPPPPR
jgi:plasmid stability protein